MSLFCLRLIAGPSSFPWLQTQKGLTLMDKQSSVLAATIQNGALRPVEATGKTPDAVKDMGRVRIGAGMLRFTAGTPSDATKDAGRVRIGAGMLRF